MAVSYFPNLVILQTGTPKNFCHKISTKMLLSGSFWHSSSRACGSLFTPNGLLSINVKVRCLLLAEIYFVVCLNGFIKGSDRV